MTWNTSICFLHQAKINNYLFQLSHPQTHCKWTIISIHMLPIILRLLSSPLGRWIPLQMICINTCQCFVSHWYLMNFKHCLFFSGNFPCSHKMMSSPVSLSSSGSVLAGCFRALPLLLVWFHLTRNISFSQTCVWTSNIAWKLDAQFIDGGCTAGLNKHLYLKSKLL